jgi:serine/threonine protein kinase
MLTYDPKKRIAAVDAIKHPWFGLKLKETKDNACTLSALKNLKNFRVSFSKLTHSRLMRNFNRQPSLSL